MASTVWRGHLTFGLISLPVRLFRAARAQRMPLRRVARASSPGQISGTDTELEAKRRSEHGAVPQGGSTLAESTAALEDISPTSGPSPLVALRQVNVSQVSGSEVSASAVTRAVEVQKNRFVEIPSDEYQNLKAATSADMAISEFVALAEIDPLYFETSYYVVPEEAGEKAYALLYQALVKTNLVALAEIAMHGRDHVIVIRPGQSGLVAHTMFYVSEVHLDEQFEARVESIQAKELDLATMLVSSLTSNFEPEKYRSGYHQKLQALIESRVGSQAEPKLAVTAKSGADIVDISDALRKSLAQLKKPAQKTSKPVRAARATGSVRTATRSGS